jgi:hypothetical protein
VLTTANETKEGRRTSRTLPRTKISRAFFPVGEQRVRNQDLVWRLIETALNSLEVHSISFSDTGMHFHFLLLILIR